ncbi:uncharacterized protein LOC118446239 [Vespa mandarinia]|uniref:uncharacterized protein LOC118446239 n=1 Tax=Vespa mandarinia TaxID=7446 RepID=UPI001610A063|nr:uncharacterized protein LOC118446239 [Vespa mandarinia]
MNTKQAFFTIVFLLVSMHITKCHLMRKLLERIDLPQLGHHMHNNMFITSKVFKPIYDRFKTYFINIHPRLANRSNLINRINSKCIKINSQEIIEPIAVINPMEMIPIEDIGQINAASIKHGDVIPIEPVNAVPIEPVDAVPIEPVDAVPIEPVDAVPIEPVDVVPIEPVDALLIEPVDPIKQVDCMPIKQTDVTPIKQVDADSVTA